MAKILSKFGEQQLVMVSYACGFNQSETGKYFEWIIISIIIHPFETAFLKENNLAVILNKSQRLSWDYLKIALKF